MVGNLPTYPAGKLQPDLVLEQPDHGIGLNATLGIQHEAIRSLPGCERTEVAGDLAVEIGDPILPTDPKMIEPVTDHKTGIAQQHFVLGHRRAEVSRRLDSAPNTAGTVGGTSATLGGSKTGPFSFGSLPADFQISVDGGPNTTITLGPGDFRAPGLVSAQELASYGVKSVLRKLPLK